MNIAKFCIRHKVTTLLAVIMIAVFGVVYTTQLQMALLPNIEYPAAYVYCYYNGAGPEDIEQLVTRPLESAIMSVPGVDSVTSSSADSISTIQIMYVENTDVDIAATKLREKFSEAGYDVRGVHWQAPVYWFLHHIGALREGHKA